MLTEYKHTTFMDMHEYMIYYVHQLRLLWAIDLACVHSITDPDTGTNDGICTSVTFSLKFMQ